ncbi:MAG: glycosyltransferase [Thermodesulfobacteriota bacterium]
MSHVIEGLEKHRYSPGRDEEALLPRYTDLVGREAIRNMEEYRERFSGKIVHVNSTFEGGGVAELLEREVRLSNELGIQMEWFKILGHGDFFDTTKGFHNALQGRSSDNALTLIKNYNHFYNNGGRELNSALIGYLQTLGKDDVIVIHDPQPLYLINFLEEVKALKLWRIHIDTTAPDARTMEYVVSHATRYNGIISTMAGFIKPHVGSYEQLFTLAPSIDPFSDKNSAMGSEEITERVERHGIRAGVPLLVQVSRLDPWKDPVGVIRAFDMMRDSGQECQLALVYNSASDDPEGAAMESLVREERAKSLYHEDIHLILGDDPRDVNAFQRYASIVIQKSIREGFGLTVTEALYKKNVVVATEVGGIALQVQDCRTGYTIAPYSVTDDGRPRSSREYREHIAALAERCNRILNRPDDSVEIGAHGKERVMKNFLALSALKNLYDIFISYRQ